VRRVAAAAAVKVGSARRRRVVRTAAEGRVLAAAALQLGSAGRRHVVRTAAVRRVQTAALAVRTVGRRRVCSQRNAPSRKTSNLEDASNPLGVQSVRRTVVQFTKLSLDGSKCICPMIKRFHNSLHKRNWTRDGFSLKIET